MLTSTLRAVGGSVMMAIPKAMLESLGLSANAKVTLRIDEAGRLVVEPRQRPRYTLEELVARCEPDTAQDEEARDWDQSGPIGRETI
jgi:antitoxin ChpS